MEEVLCLQYGMKRGRVGLWNRVIADMAGDRETANFTTD